MLITGLHTVVDIRECSARRPACLAPAPTADSSLAGAACTAAGFVLACMLVWAA